jgi:hypothetical protein
MLCCVPWSDHLWLPFLLRMNLIVQTEALTLIAVQLCAECVRFL